MKRIGIVMAGGSGERFWPLSTPARPKQLLDLTGTGRSLLEQAIDRLAPLVDDVFISTSAALRDPIGDSGLVPRSQVIDEPCRRNTAGAITWSMAVLKHRIGEPFLAALTTADHAIGPDSGFHSTVAEAFDLAVTKGYLVTIGVVPSRPETGYGYIELGEASRVKRFTEKPDASTAEKFVASGRYLWNSGMFFWRSDVFEAELQLASPEHGLVFARLLDAFRKGHPDEASTAFEALPDLSIDYALMERSANVAYVAAKFSWDDLGTWDALLRSVSLDSLGNALIGPVTVIDSSGCVAYNATDRKVCLLQAKDQIVVVTGDSVLVAPLTAAQDVRLAARQITQ